MAETIDSGASVEMNALDADKDPRAPAAWRARIAACEGYKRDVKDDWDESIDYRRGKFFETDSDEHRVGVNKDWPNTKAKIASLFSQVPAVSLTTDAKPLQQVSPLYARALNARLAKVRADVAMDEAMPDVINAAGIGAVYVYYQTLTKQGLAYDHDTTGMDEATIQQAMQAGVLKQVPVTQITDKKFCMMRVSPYDLLWDITFTGSDFDDSDWIGHRGRMSFTQGTHEFGLTEEDREACAGGSGRDGTEKDSGDPNKERAQDKSQITYKELFYWGHRFDPTETSFRCIRRIVFVDGKQEPVVDEKWKGQVYNPETGQYLGALRFPIRVLTLTYLTDECVPPSDSAIGRPQVKELIKSRSQMVEQREHSKPIRTFDNNRVDPDIRDLLMRGIWQAMIPVNGNGQNVISELARASHPPENFEFDRVASGDLDNMWQIGPNQQGDFAGQGRTASEANIVQSNFQTRVGQERARVAKFFLGAVDVLSGLMSLYEDFKELLQPEEIQALEQVWDRKTVNPAFVFTIRPDSTVLLDSEQRVQRLLRVLNLLGKSGFINPEPLIREILELSGLDPNELIVKPEKPEPEPAKIALSFKGEDLVNPVALAFLVKSDQAPGPEDMAAAQKILMKALMPPPMPGMEGGPGGPPPEGMPPEGAMPPAGGPPAPGAPPEAPPQETMEDWNAQPRVTKRPEELGG